MLNYKFIGKDTRGLMNYKAEGIKLINLYNDLVDQDIISIVDGDPYELAVLEKAGLTWDDFSDDVGDLDYDKFQAWRSAENDLNHEELLEVITSQNGNAYYQIITAWDEDNQEEQVIYRKWM